MYKFTWQDLIKLWKSNESCEQESEEAHTQARDWSEESLGLSLLYLIITWEVFGLSEKKKTFEIFIIVNMNVLFINSPRVLTFEAWMLFSSGSVY